MPFRFKELLVNDINDNHRVGGSTVIRKSIRLCVYFFYSITLCSEGRKAGIGERNFEKKKIIPKWFLETTHKTI